MTQSYICVHILFHCSLLQNTGYSSLCFTIGPCCKWKLLSCVWLFVTPWTVSHQAPLSMEFSRQEYWSGLPCLPPRDLPNPGNKPMSLISPTLASGFCNTSTTWEAPWRVLILLLKKWQYIFSKVIIDAWGQAQEGLGSGFNVSSET